MTQRDRQASAQVYEKPPQDRRPCSPAAETAAAVASWQQIFQNASPPERERLLTLAQKQGLLFSHQFPQSAPAQINGQTPLAQVLSGGRPAWTPVRVQPVEVADGALDPIQREAVAKALQTPDICLIQGLPGTGKRRVATEIIHQAAARGERVLLLAPRTGALDGLLERANLAETVLAVRCLNQDEDPAQLPPTIRRLTFAVQVAALKEQSLRHTCLEASAAQERLDHSRRQEALWSRIQELAEAQCSLAERLESLNRRKTLLLDIVHGEAAEVETNGTAETSFQSSLVATLAPLRAALARVDDSLAEVRKQIAALEKERQERESRLGLLRPFAEAKRRGRWWTPLWWRATFSSDRLAQAAAFETERMQAQATLDKRNHEVRELLQEQERIREAVQTACLHRTAVELERRRAELDSEENDLFRDRGSLEFQWQEACRELGPDAQIPEPENLEAVMQATQTLHTRVRQEEQQADFARLWAEALAHEADKLHLHLRACANLVAATTQTLSTDEHFGGSSRAAPRFDLMILIEAHDLTEEEFARVAGLANRLVLIGEPAFSLEPLPSPSRQPIPGKTSQFSALRPGLLPRLWNALHCDPRRLPYAWFREGERICCRLHSVTPGQRRWVEREGVADFPEIELRILAPPRKAPVLAEVLFPAGYTIQQAKEYILRELEEWPISAYGSSVRWDEQPDRIVLRLAEDPLPNSVPVPLDVGVREIVGTPAEGLSLNQRSPNWQTWCLEFERAAGWHRDGAEQWVQKHLGLVDLGRTARLDQPYRMRPDLALFLSHLLFDGEYRAGTGKNGEAAESLKRYAAWGPPVEFIPVVAVANGRGSLSPSESETYKGSNRVTAATARQPTRAGLEVSLADPLQRNALPADLRAGLPREGIVNIAEARVVIQALETLVHDPEFRALTPLKGRPTVGVVALSAAQAELLRRLIDQTPTLLAANVEFFVSVPEALRDRECLATLVSLTRSPGNRIASVSAEPRRLIWALTRASSKLLIFGDPEALQRRCQWEGPVDQLDDASARQEREILGRLVQYLDGAGAFPHMFHLREGGWA